MRAALLFLFAGCAFVARSGERVFAASFDDYAVGEALSEKGTTGGAWRVEGTATNVVAAGQRAMDVRGKAAFACEQAATNTVERIDLPLQVGPLSLTDIRLAGEAGGFMPALIAEATPGYLVWGSGAWQRTMAAGADPVEGAWIDLRVEFKTVEGRRLVRYLVKDAQGTYVACRTAEGRVWFLAGGEAGAHQVEFLGKGAFAGLDGREEHGSEERCFHWTGGAAGDWNVAANWAEGLVPDAGSFAFVTNAVLMTNGTEVAQVNALVVADGSALVGGEVKTTVELKTNRPRAGVELSPDAQPFFGVVPDYTYTWARGTWAKAWETSACGCARSYTPTAADYGKWLRLTVSNATEAVYSKAFFFSPLPVCYLATDDGGEPTAQKEEHTGDLFIQGNDAFKHQYDGRLTFKVRGNSSASHPKKSYKLKLDDKAKLFALGPKKDRHWILTASYNDMSLLRNKLAADFANATGSLGMHATWVDCVLNGDYRGTYLLSESIRIAEGRVNIFDWEDAATGFGATETDFSAIDALLASDPSSVDITGGYLFELSINYDELSQFKISSGKLVVPTMLSEPEYLYTSTNMMQWCARFCQRYWDACTSVTHLSDEGRHWSEYADVDSMVAYWLVNELHGNLDAYQKSRYVSIDRGGKLMWGPVWDFDYAAASITIPTAQAADTWMCTNRDWSQSANTWNESSWANFDRSAVYKEWASDPYFCLKAWERYWEIRAQYAALSEDGGTVDQAAASLAGPLAVNDARWPRSRDHASDTSIYKNYLRARLAWLDQQCASVESLMLSLTSDSQTVPYVRNEVVIQPAVDVSGAVLSAQVAGTAQVLVLLNGHNLGRFAVVNGTLAPVDLPRAFFAKGENKLNCLSLVAFSSAGTVVARNYALFPTPASTGLRLFFR